MCKKPPKKGIPLNFHEFEIKEVHYEKFPPKSIDV
jgi:hypothetical protein